MDGLVKDPNCLKFQDKGGANEIFNDQIWLQVY